MQLIHTKAGENGYRPPIQSCDWEEKKLPNGFSIMPDDFDTTAFYAYNGFVTLTIEDGVVTAMEPNLEAWEAWKAEEATQAQQPLPEPTPEQQLRADVDYISVMTGVNL